MNIAEALLKLAPGAHWSLNNNDYNQLEWFSTDIPKPTILEIEAKIVELKAAEPMKRLRKERDRLLKETDWWAVSDRTMTPEQTSYRQALRDLPSTATPVLDETDPIGISGVTWPTKP